MVTHPKAHHVLFLALVFGVGAASPCLARLAEEDFSTGETTTNLSGFAGIVRSYADDFTDAYQGTLRVLPKPCAVPQPHGK